MALIKKIPLWLILLEVPFIYLAYQYFLRNSLEVYDASSHLAQISYIKEYLWPNISGFNSLNLLGFDQGLLYPSLFHYLAATLGFVIGVDLATKAIVIAALLALPLSLYSFTSNFFISRNARAFCTGLLLVVLIALPGYLGANLKGLLQVGLLPSFVSLPLVFFYLWSQQKKNPSFVLSTILLTSVILTHLVAGVFCLLVFAGYTLTRVLSKSLKSSYFGHLALALGLAGFFLIPFLFNYSLISQSVHPSSLLIPNVVVLVILGLLLISFWKTKKEKLYPVTAVGVILAVVVVIDAVTLRFLDSGLLFDKVYNLHLYRYQVYLYLLTTTLLCYWPARFLFEFSRRSKIKSEFIVLLPIIVLCFASFVRPAFIVSQVSVKTDDNGTNGRFLELFTREDSYPFIYSSQNKLVQENKPWAYGLLTDSTPNGPYLGSLIRSFDPFAKNETEAKFIERRSLDRARQYQILDLLGIENLLFLNPTKSITKQSIDTKILKSGVGDKLVEIPKLPTKAVNNDWDKQVEKWWFEKGKLNSILVENGESFKSATPSATIKNLKHSPDWTKFSFDVESSEATPVLVKFTYLPGWQALNQGKKIEIHRASPYLMLVYASGRVEFKYGKVWYQYLGWLISITSLVVLVVVITKDLAKKNAKR